MKPEKRMKMQKPKKYWRELTFKGKLSYLRQYYFIPGLIVLSVLGFGYLTYRQATNVSPDLTIFVIGDQVISKDQVQHMQDSMKGSTFDVTGDKVKEISIQRIKTKTASDGTAKKGDESNLNVQLHFCYSFILIASPQQYQLLRAEHPEMTLMDITPYTKKSIDGKAVPIKDTGFAKRRGFSSLPDDYLVALYVGTPKLNLEYASTLQQYTTDTFEKIVQNK